MIPSLIVAGTEQQQQNRTTHHVVPPPDKINLIENYLLNSDTNRCRSILIDHSERNNESDSSNVCWRWAPRLAQRWLRWLFNGSTRLFPGTSEWNSLAIRRPANSEGSAINRMSSHLHRHDVLTVMTCTSIQSSARPPHASPNPILTGAYLREII